MARVLSTCFCWTLLVLLSSALPSLADPVRGQVGEAPDVTIAQGVIKGIEATSLRGRNFYSYRGIPYAKAPVGDLRFRAPVPVDPSSDVIDATKDGPMCTQKNVRPPPPSMRASRDDCLTINVYTPQAPVPVDPSSDVIDATKDVPMCTQKNVRPPPPTMRASQEDCLTINVYTPQIEGASLPVMVYIHGGGWTSGTGASTKHGPDYLLDRDIILVTFNYRLAALGFLSTGDSVAPGNYAFKDQVAALKWVRDNIAAFGGNPGSVTLFGMSAGAHSVHLHMLSKQSEGLFHRAISQSGTAMSPSSWPSLNPYLIAKAQASYFNCPTDDSQQIIDCLRQVDAQALTDSADIFHFWDIEPAVTFGPVIEDPFTTTSFLTGHPWDLLRSGRINKVPWIVGAVAQEGIIRSLSILNNKTLLDDLNTNWNSLGPRIFFLDQSIEDPVVMQDMWKNITTFYFNDQLPITEDNGIHLIDLYSDRTFVQGIHQSALHHAAQGHDTVYLYNFNYRGRDSLASLYTGSSINYGVCHTDDLIYIFKKHFPAWPENHPDRKMVDGLLTLWTNFATYGTPTPPGDSPSSHVTCDLASTETDNRCDLSHLSWTPVSVSSPLRTSYLNIYASNKDTLDFAMEQDFYKERMAFWDQSPLKENL